MNLRENVRAVLQYEPFDHMPVIHFGYWQETLEKWREEGHLTAREIENYYDGSPSDRLIARKLGFDYGWAAHRRGEYRPFSPALKPELWSAGRTGPGSFSIPTAC